MEVACVVVAVSTLVVDIVCCVVMFGGEVVWLCAVTGIPGSLLLEPVVVVDVTVTKSCVGVILTVGGVFAVSSPGNQEA